MIKKFLKFLFREKQMPWKLLISKADKPVRLFGEELESRIKDHGLSVEEFAIKAMVRRDVVLGYIDNKDLEKMPAWHLYFICNVLEWRVDQASYLAIKTSKYLFEQRLPSS